MLNKMLLAFGLGVGLSACGSIPTRIALAPVTKQKLTEFQVVSVIPQDEIVLRAISPGAGVALGGGLIGAIIDSKVGESRQTVLQEAIAPFYASVDDFDFRAVYKQAMTTSLADAAAVKIGAVRHASLLLSNADVSARSKLLPADQGFLFMLTSYTFTPDYRFLTVSSYAQISTAASETPVFMNRYSYVSAALGDGGSASLAAWGSGNGARYRAVANEAAEQLMAMLKLDLASGATDAAGLRQIPFLAAGAIAPATPPQVPVLQALQARAIVRTADGNLHSLPQ
jgi:hypothetical protein